MTAKGVVVSASQVRAERVPSGALVRTLFDLGAVPDAVAGPGARAGDEAGGGRAGGLGRRLVDVPAQSALAGTAGARGELWFVIEGDGWLEAGVGSGQRLRGGGSLRLRLRSDQGLFLPPGLEYSVHADGPAGVRLDMVALPSAPDDPPGVVGSEGTGVDGASGVGASTGSGGAGGVSTGSGGAGGAGGTRDRGGPVSRNLADCEVEMTGDRRFRVLFGPGRDCDIATQFVGEIPPGRAPDHSHPYDELVLILNGTGAAHLGGIAHAVSPGTCLHLPPGLSHCLENTGSSTMRVLGVFHPADSPAAKLRS